MIALDAQSALVAQHYKDTLQNIQKLHKKTPRSVVFFLAGCLPALAILHMRQLSIFGMVTKLRENPLNLHARNILTSWKSSSKSWVFQIRDICMQYSLPHPLQLLDNPLGKESLKKLVKSHVVDYWEVTLRAEVSLLPSLPHFFPHFMSLTDPHPLCTSAGANPYEVSKAVQQARLLSGRYRTENLCRHWSSNRNGWCMSGTCQEQVETVEHMIVVCKAYQEVREQHFSMWLSHPDPVVRQLLSRAVGGTPTYLTQFILDCSVLPEVIVATQENGSEVLIPLF